MSDRPTSDARGAAGPAVPHRLGPDRLAPAERTRHRLAGEVLLTDDGRTPETSRAKSVAIPAVAGRMRSSTPELVLAAFDKR